MNDGQQTGVWRRLLGVFACLCFALEPLVVPLHLALEHHAPGASQELVENADVHSHSHSGQDHDHDHDHDHDRGSDEKASSGDHPTHPAEDHVSDLPDPATSPAPVVLVALALLPASLKLVEPSTFTGAFAPTYEPPPPRPPPGAVASPRAPPVVA